MQGDGSAGPHPQRQAAALSASLISQVPGLWSGLLLRTHGEPVDTTEIDRLLSMASLGWPPSDGRLAMACTRLRQGGLDELFSRLRLSRHPV